MKDIPGFGFSKNHVFIEENEFFAEQTETRLVKIGKGSGRNGTRIGFHRACDVGKRLTSLLRHRDDLPVFEKIAKAREAHRFVLPLGFLDEEAQSFLSPFLK